MNVVCVTAICGTAKDFQLLEDQENSDGVRFVCFTDNPEFKSDVWEIFPACTEFDGRWDAPIRNAKRHKIMIHEYVDCEYSLWMDGNTILLKPVTHLIDTYLKDHDVATFKHPARDCAYKEMETCASLNLDIEEVMREQMRAYEAEGYPRLYGLNAGGFILRRHTEQVKNFNELWWREICKHSKRDQLSLNYCLWKTGLKMNEFDDYWHSQLKRWS